MKTIQSVLSVGIVLGLIMSVSAKADSVTGNMPVCYSYKRQALSPANAHVLSLKTSTPNSYKEQVLIQGYLVKVLPDTVNGYGRHQHFIVSLVNPSSPDFQNPAMQIEVAHSRNEYSAPPETELGKGVISLCGEYTTADFNKLPKITKYSPSITGALIHWTHLAGPNVDGFYGHPNGWIFVNGIMYGGDRDRK